MRIHSKWLGLCVIIVSSQCKDSSKFELYASPHAKSQVQLRPPSSMDLIEHVIEHTDAVFRNNSSVLYHYSFCIFYQGCIKPKTLASMVTVDELDTNITNADIPEEFKEFIPALFSPISQQELSPNYSVIKKKQHQMIKSFYLKQVAARYVSWCYSNDYAALFYSFLPWDQINKKSLLKKTICRSTLLKGLFQILHHTGDYISSNKAFSLLIGYPLFMYLKEFTSHLQGSFTAFAGMGSDILKEEMRKRGYIEEDTAGKKTKTRSKKKKTRREEASDFYKQEEGCKFEDGASDEGQCEEEDEKLGPQKRDKRLLNQIIGIANPILVGCRAVVKTPYYFSLDKENRFIFRGHSSEINNPIQDQSASNSGGANLVKEQDEIRVDNKKDDNAVINADLQEKVLEKCKVAVAHIVEYYKKVPECKTYQRYFAERDQDRLNGRPIVFPESPIDIINAMQLSEINPERKKLCGESANLSMINTLLCYEALSSQFSLMIGMIASNLHIVSKSFTTKAMNLQKNLQAFNLAIVYFKEEYSAAKNAEDAIERAQQFAQFEGHKEENAGKIEDESADMQEKLVKLQHDSVNVKQEFDRTKMEDRANFDTRLSQFNNMESVVRKGFSTGEIELKIRGAIEKVLAILIEFFEMIQVTSTERLNVLIYLGQLGKNEQEEQSSYLEMTQWMKKVKKNETSQSEKILKLSLPDIYTFINDTIAAFNARRSAEVINNRKKKEGKKLQEKIVVSSYEKEYVKIEIDDDEETESPIDNTQPETKVLQERMNINSFLTNLSRRIAQVRISACSTIGESIKGEREEMFIKKKYGADEFNGGIHVSSQCILDVYNSLSEVFQSSNPLSYFLHKKFATSSVFKGLSKHGLSRGDYSKTYKSLRHVLPWSKSISERVRLITFDNSKWSKYLTSDIPLSKILASTAENNEKTTKPLLDGLTWQSNTTELNQDLHNPSGVLGKIEEIIRNTDGLSPSTKLGLDKNKQIHGKKKLRKKYNEQIANFEQLNHVEEYQVDTSNILVKPQTSEIHLQQRNVSIHGEDKKDDSNYEENQRKLLYFNFFADDILHTIDISPKEKETRFVSLSLLYSKNLENLHILTDYYLRIFENLEAGAFSKLLSQFETIIKDLDNPRYGYVQKPISSSDIALNPIAQPDENIKGNMTEEDRISSLKRPLFSTEQSIPVNHHPQPITPYKSTYNPFSQYPCNLPNKRLPPTPTTTYFPDFQARQIFPNPLLRFNLVSQVQQPSHPNFLSANPYCLPSQKYSVNKSEHFIFNPNQNSFNQSFINLPSASSGSFEEEVSHNTNPYSKDLRTQALQQQNLYANDEPLIAREVLSFPLLNTQKQSRASALDALEFEAGLTKRTRQELQRIIPQVNPLETAPVDTATQQQDDYIEDSTVEVAKGIKMKIGNIPTESNTNQREKNRARKRINKEIKEATKEEHDPSVPNVIHTLNNHPSFNFFAAKDITEAFDFSNPQNTNSTGIRLNPFTSFQLNINEQSTSSSDPFPYNISQMKYNFSRVQLNSFTSLQNNAHELSLSHPIALSDYMAQRNIKDMEPFQPHSLPHPGYEDAKIEVEQDGHIEIETEGPNTIKQE